MAWNDRIREAAYTSPSGTRLSFSYENVAKSVEKRTTGFEFPDADGTYVQDLGHGGRKYPLRVFFWGDDYDQESDAFEDLLLERGTGKLDHPIYGSVDVVPFGAISRRDDLKTAANQSIIEVTFWETVGLVYPSSQDDAGADVLTSVSEYGSAISDNISGSLLLDKAIERASFKNTYESLLDSVTSGLQSIADAQDNVRDQFDAISDSISNGIDVLIQDPLTLAFQTVNLIQAPARALSDIRARLNAYGGLLRLVTGGDRSVSKPGNDSINANQFYVNDLYASTYISGSILSVVNNQFSTKTEALGAADQIISDFDNLTVWRDDNYESLGEVDSGQSYQKLQEAVALTAGFLVEISFSLKQERKICVDRNRTIIDLSAEIYGSVDENLDFLIASNDLSGSEILELPKGRQIVYYI
jgi:hypothetical protein